MFLDPVLAGALSKYKSTVHCVDVWDRQTVVIVCDNNMMMSDVRSKILAHKNPQSHTESKSYMIDGFVNLNYDKSEKDPANRNVRIVYCNIADTTKFEIDSRFPNSYIIRVREKGGIDYDTDGQSRPTSGKIFEISSRTRRTQ